MPRSLIKHSKNIIPPNIQKNIIFNKSLPYFQIYSVIASEIKVKLLFFCFYHKDFIDFL